MALSKGDFEIVKPIGQGQYGRVWKTRCPKLGDGFFALKQVDGRLDECDMDSVQKEVRALEALDHANIVKFVSSFQGSNDGFPALLIVMEHCDSDMERDLVQDPKIPLQAIHSFLKQMQSALDYLFNYNMIHSDIKPSNILTQRSQVIQPGPSVSIWSPEWGTIFKLCDFGSVKDLTVMGRNAGSYLSMSYDGTKAYNAPEMRKHHFDLLNRKPRVKDVNAKVDSWSVGIILLQCLVGRAPEGQEVKRELEILRKNPELLPFIEKVLQPLLEEDSHQRAFVHELEF